MVAARLSRDRQELIYALYRRGVLLKDIAVVVGVRRETVGIYVARLRGMPRPEHVRYDGRYLSLDERNEIARLLDTGHGIRAIATRLGRAPSTISREVHRHRDPVTGYYLPSAADTRAWHSQRRPKSSKLARHPVLREKVQQWLEQRYSPDQISGRLKVDYPEDDSMRISHEAIYQSIYVYPRGELKRELSGYLRRGGTTRQPRGTRGARTHPRGGPIAKEGMVSIHQRPQEVAARLVPGHHEGDLIKGTIASNSAVGTIVERHSGFLTLIHLAHGWSADKVAVAVTQELNAMPPWFAKTLTWDRGSEMARHAEITAATGIQVYFADPRCPQQRPSNENTNGLVREYLPKGTDLSIHSRAELQTIADALNDRPRKRLGYLTPREVFTQLLEEHTPTSTVATTT